MNEIQYRAVNRPLIRAMAATGIEAAVGATDIAFERVLDDAAIDSRLLSDPMQKLELADYCRLMDIAAERTGDPLFGARYGQSFVARHFGPIGYLVVSSATLEDALIRLAGYFPWIQENSRLRFSRNRTFGVLEYQIHDARIGSRRQDAELTIAAYCGLIRCCLKSQWAPVEVHFEHERSGGLRDYDVVFRAPVYFAASSNRILIDNASLSTPLPNRDPDLLAVLEGLIRDQLSIETRHAPEFAHDGFVATVSYLIERGCKDGRPSMSAVAGELGKTMHRMRNDLRQSSLSFDDLVNSVRRDLALKHVASGRPLTELALSLGYSELSAFSRAFRRWTGASPTAYRREPAATGQ